MQWPPAMGEKKIEARRISLHMEQRIAAARSRSHKRQAKRLRRSASRHRQDALHKFYRNIVDRYQIILIGDLSSLKPVKARKEKFALTAGWGMLKTQLQ